MRLEVNIEKKYLFIIFGVILLVGGIVFVIAQGVPNPGHGYNELSGVQADINPNNCALGQVVRGVADNGNLNCVTDQGGGGGGAQIAQGSYTGTGVNNIQNINVGFIPESVTVIKRDDQGPQDDSVVMYKVNSMIQQSGWESYFTGSDSSGGIFGDSIDITSNGFSVRNHANAPSDQYYYIAIG